MVMNGKRATRRGEYKRGQAIKIDQKGDCGDVLSGNSLHEEKDTKKIGKYEILRELGRGAMGVVFKARDPLIGRLVALKTIALAASQSDDLWRRFYREAQAAGGLQHPNIVTVYEMGRPRVFPSLRWNIWKGRASTRRSKGTRKFPSRKSWDTSFRFAARETGYP